MNTKLKWLCITLMCALIFVSIGYAAGQMIATERCNNYWTSKEDACNTVLKLDTETIHPDTYITPIQINITPIEAK